MKPELENQAWKNEKNGKHLEQLTSVEIEDFDEPKNRGLNFRPLWRVMRRNILLVTGITTVVAAAALYSGLSSPRSYEGSFRLLIEPITSEAKFTDPSVLSRDRSVATSDSMNSVDYPSLLQVLQSFDLMSGITNQIQAKYPDVTYELLKKNLVVQRLGTDLTNSTKIVEVLYKDENPEKVLFVLSEVAKAYLKYSLDYRKTRIGLGVEFIEDQLPGLQQQVDNLQGALQALQQRYRLSDPASEGGDLSKQLREIEAQKLQTERELREQQTLYMSLQRQLKLAPEEALAASTLSEDPHYQDLVGQLKKVESQIAVESARFTEYSPSIQALRQQQRNLSRLLNQENQKKLRQNLRSKAANPEVLSFQNSLHQDLIKQLVDTANQVQLLAVRYQAIAQAEYYLNQQVRQFPAIMRQHNDLKRRLEISTNTLNQLLVQRQTLRLEAAQKEVPWQLVSQPMIPRDEVGHLIASEGDTTKKLAMGVIGGLLLGLGSALFKERYRNVFYSTEDIQDAIKLPILGVTPFDNSANQFVKYSALAESVEAQQPKNAQTALFLESFNYLYASIRFLCIDSPVRSLVVSSATPEDGKTTIALHLAQAAAVMGQRVLLVDASLCQPQLHTRLGLPNLQGLTNLLTQNLEPHSLIQRSHGEENLFVLTSGQLLPDCTKLLASNKMQQLVAQLTSSFDLVIYDTSHLLGFTDAYFLAAHTDGILMVVGIGKTNRSALMQVMGELNNVRLPILGVVANQVEQSANSSSSYYNRYYERHQKSFALSPNTYS